VLLSQLTHRHLDHPAVVAVRRTLPGNSNMPSGLPSPVYAHQVIDDRDRDLGTVLSYLVGRPVRSVELA
jgi:hypothetical protein